MSMRIGSTAGRLVLVTAAAALAGTALLVPASASAGFAATGPSDDTLMFHGNAARTGWSSHEGGLTPQAVSGPNFGPVWNSPQFDSVTLGSTTYEPHLYASPLYADGVPITAGVYKGSSFGVVFAATSTGWVYAVKAFGAGSATNVNAGTILWRTRLGQPSSKLDGGVTVGVLGTPVIDRNVRPARLYVTTDVTDAGGRNWKVFALDLGTGSVLPGWPVTINDTTLAPINRNGPTTFEPASAMSQRGALTLSADGKNLYVPFGAYGAGGAGWMVTLDTSKPALASAFAGAPTTVAFANGGMWGSGGPAVDSAGTVYETTGNSPAGSSNAPNVWGNSLLAWKPGTPLALSGTYSPWNHCQMDQYDTDLGGDSPTVVDLDPATTSTPHLIVFGGKQGNAYLLDRDHLPGRLDHRPLCSTDSSTDTSLLPPGNQPQFSKPGPLSIFAPYSEDANNTNFAKSRTTSAAYTGAHGTTYVVIAGSTKKAVGDITPIPPSVVRLKIVTSPGKPAYLAVDCEDTTLSIKLAGAPIVTSGGTANPIVWVLDSNVFRSDSLRGAGVPHPILYALDASTLKVLWHSTPDQLQVSGKYNQPTVAHDTVFVGTDRIQAFGLRTAGSVMTIDDAVQGSGPGQFQYNGPGWFHCTTGCITGSYNGTVSGTDAAGESATIIFTGTQVKFYTDQRSNRGIAAVSIDAGAETNVDMYAAADAGDVLIWTSPSLTTGTHTFKIRNSGAHNTASTGTRIAVDRIAVDRLDVVS